MESTKGEVLMELCYVSKSLKSVQAVPCLKSLSLDLFTLTKLHRGANNLGTLFKRAESFVLFCFPFILTEDHSFFTLLGLYCPINGELITAGGTTSATAEASLQASLPPTGARYLH